MFLTRFIEHHFSHSSNFIYPIIRIFRLTLITIGTSSAIYAIKFLPKLREKELALEQSIKQRLTLENLIIDRTTNDEQLNKQIIDLHEEYEHLYDVYIQLISEENQLSHTIQKFLDNQQLLHHSLPMDKNEQEFSLSTVGDNHSLISKVSPQLCLPNYLLNESENNKIIGEPIQLNPTINYRPKKLFPRIFWLKKKKHHNSQGAGDA